MTAETDRPPTTSTGDRSAFTAALSRFVDQHGVSLEEHTRYRPAVVVFLRHGGCPFCRETLALLQKARAAVEAAGVGIVLVHLMSEPEAAALFARYALEDMPRYGDPDRKLYEFFGLLRARFDRVAGPRVWWRGLMATLRGHLPGVPRGDIFQLPGTFLVRDGEILHASRPETSAGQVDFVEFVKRA